MPESFRWATILGQHTGPSVIRGIFASFAVLGELERYRVGPGHGRRRTTGIARRRGQVDWTCAHRSVRALPELRLSRTGFHELSVGRAAARGGLFGHISYGWIEDRRLALPLVGLSLPVSGGHHEAAVR